MKSILFAGLLLILALSGCTQSKSVSLASNPTPPPGNAASAGEGSEVHDPPPLLEFPKADGFVNDFAGVLSEKDKQNLETALKKLQERAKIDFAIAVVTTTGDRTPFDYSLAMAKQWNIGSENGGILFVAAVDDRKWHIQITKNLEDELPNAEVKKIGDVVVPDFKNKKYGAGIKKCVNKMIAELAKKQGFEPITVK
jgi:uncharacterized membrane protein YgcG